MSVAAATAKPHQGSQLAGLGLCIRLILRRNWLFYTLWVAGLSMLMPATIQKYGEFVEPGPQGAALLAQLTADPTMRAICGIPFNLSTPGGFTVFRIGTFMATALAMMAGFGVIRATRGEEEPGRLELLCSGAIGRHMPLMAAITVASLACAVVGLLQIPLLMATGAPAAGSTATGLALMFTGLMWVGVGAVCAQIFETSRSAASWAMGVGLGGLYVLRAIVDGSAPGSVLEPLRWAMPLDWFALVRAFAGERWWVLLLPGSLAFTLVVLAFVLESRRDHGVGLRPAAPSRADGPGYLVGPAGLVWRLSRTGMIGWTVGILGSAASMGSLALSVDTMLTDNPKLAEMFQRMGAGSSKLSEAFYVAMLGIVIVPIALAGMLVITRMRAEEMSSRSDHVLATAVSRTRYALAHLGWGIALSTLLTLGTGLLLPVVQASREHNPHLLGTYLTSAAALLPGVWLVLGITMLVIGWVPTLTPAVWLVISWSLFVSWIAPLFDLPTWLTTLHPWGHLPHLPTDELRWVAISVETLLAVALMVAGIVGYQRRDVTAA